MAVIAKALAVCKVGPCASGFPEIKHSKNLLLERFAQFEASYLNVESP